MARRCREIGHVFDEDVKLDVPVDAVQGDGPGGLFEEAHVPEGHSAVVAAAGEGAVRHPDEIVDAVLVGVADVMESLGHGVDHVDAAAFVGGQECSSVAGVAQGKALAFAKGRC